MFLGRFSDNHRHGVSPIHAHNADLHRQIVTYTRGNQDLLDAFQIARFAIQFNRWRVVGVHMRADTREHARGDDGRFLRARTLTTQFIHVGGRATQIGNHAGKTRNLIADLFNLSQDRFMGTTLDLTAFMFGNRTE